MEYINSVEMKNISMQFPGVLANDDINFSVRKGEIHALVGENGAGKTTLMNILYGLYVPTKGEIIIDGEHVKFYSPIDAMAKGIGMVHQHFMLIPKHTVAENIVLGVEPKKGLIFQRDEAERKVKEISDKYNFYVDPKAKVSDISFGMQQRVEIVKALYRGAEILILDEPTAMLTPQEIDELGNVLKDLKKHGKTIIIITHKLKEVMAFSDRVTVLRAGKYIGTVDTKNTNPEEITYMMVGRNINKIEKLQVDKDKETLLEVKNLSYEDRFKKHVKNVSFQLKKGEILGIAGIDGSGQNELMSLISGAIKPDSGSVTLEGEYITNEEIINRRKKGVTSIPYDRQKLGLVLDASIQENLLLGSAHPEKFLKNNTWLQPGKINEIAEEGINRYKIRANGPKTIVRTLSGGNQQKVIVAREVHENAKVILANQPTRGVDIGAIELIHRSLVDLRNKGQAVLLVSLELDEVMELSDRIAVMYDGEIMDIVDADKITREEIGFLMVGHKRQEEKINGK
ncbi:MAG TPA: ABC transporter ATP-binding protein [Tissierellaceae bacterium]